jgi:transcriptional regulator with XRE-family HTH domain
MLHTIQLPIPVQRILRKIGADLRDARRRRGISTTLMAERCSISRTTLNKLEKGDRSVAFGIYATVLFVLGMTDRLAEIADAKHDVLGISLEAEHLPQRIHNKKLTKIQKGGKS